MTPGVLIVLIVFSLAMILGTTTSVLFSTFAYTPVDLGGLEWEPPMIAAMVSVVGVAQGLWLLFLMPPLDRRYGSRALTRACFAVWPFMFLFPIITNQLARHGHSNTVIVAGIAWQIISGGVSMVFSELNSLQLSLLN